MIRREGSRLMVSGRATLDTIAALLEEGRRHLSEGVAIVDLSEVRELDSSLLAALIDWQRAAHAQQNDLRIENMPPGLQTIARLYGVQELLSAAGT